MAPVDVVGHMAFFFQIQWIILSIILKTLKCPQKCDILKKVITKTKNNFHMHMLIFPQCSG